MRIVMISPVIGDSFGQEQVMRTSSRLLREAGHSVCFLGDVQKGPVPDNDGVGLIPGLSAVDIRTPTREANKLNRRAITFIDRMKPDVVHLIDQFDSRFQSQLCRRFPVMLTSHLLATTCPSSTRLISHQTGSCTKRSGYMCLVHNKSYGCLSHFKNDVHRLFAVRDYKRRRRSLTKANLVVAVSRFVEEELLKDGWPRDQIRLIYNPVEAVEIGEVPRKVADAPRSLILCASRLERVKGIHILIEALSRLKSLEWELWICGDGNQRKSLVDLCDKLDLKARVKFHGWTDHASLRSIMAASRLMVQPNLGPEPFGLSVAEASAMGIPVVASRIGAIDEIIEDRVNGLLCGVGDVAALADGISKVLSDDRLAKSLSNNGPQIIQDRFSGARHLKATLEAYRRCAGIFT
jgi:glycosyltransferase involved in cell wall biosynthesis